MKILVMGAGKMGSFFIDLLSFDHEVVHRLLDELRQVRVVLQALGKLDVLDECRAYAAVHLVAKLIAVVEALAEGFHLIAVASQTDDVALSVVLKIEHEPLLLAFEFYMK